MRRINLVSAPTRPRHVRGTSTRRFNEIRTLALAVTLTALTAASVTSAEARPVSLIPHACTAQPAARLCAVHAHRRAADTYRARLGLPRLAYHWGAEARPGRRGYILHRWYVIHRHWRSVWRHRPRNPWSQSWLSSAMCIHRFEGSWTDNTGNGYYGGMQMDSSFEATYGPEFVRAYGTANNWPPRDQLTAAYRAWQSRGWTPWPNTAAICGLL